MRVYDLITQHSIPWPPPQLCLFSKCLPRGEARLDRTASWRSLELGAAVRCRAEDAWREYD